MLEALSSETRSGGGTGSTADQSMFNFGRRHTYDESDVAPSSGRKCLKSVQARNSEAYDAASRMAMRID